MRISFSGIDGTGKSTQIHKIIGYFHSNGKTLKAHHLFSNQQSVMSNLHETGLGKSIVKGVRSLKDNFFTRIIKLLMRLFNLLIDSYATTFRNNKDNLDIIIYDRYFYDVLICIIYDFPKFKTLLFMVSHLIPKPEVIIVFDANAGTVINRKPEHSLESAIQYCSLYRRLAEILGVKTIHSNATIDEIHLKVLQNIHNIR